MKPEEFEVYVIPPNFMEGGTLFGGLLKTRNTIEAVILGLAVGEIGRASCRERV